MTSDALTQSLFDHFGHSSFRPLQREIIESVLTGDPTLAILPTGGGKSLTYQLPALLSEGTCVVISPLISLIQDQTQELQSKGIAVGQYDSSLSPDDKKQELERLARGEIKLFYTSPESLAKPEIYAQLKQLHISLVAIDEAHCISDWGHSFRPAYLYLPKLVRGLKPHGILALTATATKKTASEIRKLFRIKTAQQFSASHYRPNLSFRVHPCLSEEKNQHLLDTLNSHERLPAIVYVTRQEHCEEVSSFLNKNGYKARSYHAGLHTSAREQIQDAFLSDSIEIVVATIAFGMGVDKPNIRTVIHYHLPKSPEGWMQESGRAGRDGERSLCLLLACGDDRIPLENFIQAKLISPKALSHLIDLLFSGSKQVQFSPYQFRLQYDIDQNSFNTLLARIEVMGLIRFSHSSWRYLRCWPVTGKQLDLASFPAKTRKALEFLFAQDDRFDSFTASESFGISTVHLWKTLNELHECGEIVLRPSGWIWHYQIKKPADDSLSSKLASMLTDRQATEYEKLNSVIKIATSKSCIPKLLAEWFGETLAAPCGQCSSCLNEKRPRKLPQQPALKLDESLLSQIHLIIESTQKRIKTNQQLTRFLCGIPSTHQRHYWLNKRDYFALLELHSYEDVYAIAKATLAASD